MQGLVLKSTGSRYIVEVADGTTFECAIKGKFRTKGIKSTNPIAVGDRVEFTIEDDLGVIKSIEDRSNYIVRKSTNLSKKSHILASNIDQAVLVATLAIPETSTSFIDRFLVTAEAYHIPVVIVFNKVDMYLEPTQDILEDLIESYSNIGYGCLETSATKNTNIDLFEKLLVNKTTLLAGHSGVGKSTLINAIDPSLDLKTARISMAHLTGKHTTTFAQMHPLVNGGYIIDTPGIKSFGLIDMNKQVLSQRFPEMRSIMDQCYFNNCLHINEPKCAVKDAVENGNIQDWRYRNYLSMHNDDEDEKYRAAY